MEKLVLELIDRFLENNLFLAYFIFFMSNVMQFLFPPYPADVVLVFQGYITVMGIENYGLLPILATAYAGTMTGALTVYCFGYAKGRKVLDYAFIKRFIKVKHRERAERLFQKYGAYAVFISKFVPGVNALLLLLAGMFRMKHRALILSVLMSTLIHNTAVVFLGRFLGDNMDRIMSFFKTYNRVAAGALLLSGLLYLAFRLTWGKGRSARNK